MNDCKIKYVENDFLKDTASGRFKLQAYLKNIFIYQASTLYTIINYSLESRKHEYFLEVIKTQQKIILLMSGSEYSPLNLIVSSQSIPLMQSTHSLFPNLRNANNETMLMVAVRKLKKIPPFLFSQQKIQTGNGSTALMIAAALGNDKFVRLLLSERNMQSENGQTALFYAISSKNRQCIELLLDESKLFVDNKLLLHYVTTQKNLEKQLYADIVLNIYNRTQVQFESYPVDIPQLSNKHKLTNQDLQSKYVLRNRLFSYRKSIFKNCAKNYFNVGLIQYKCLLQEEIGLKENEVDVFGRNLSFWRVLAQHINKEFDEDED
ncbi:Ankyrin_repeat-containing protein [Hexamita inflata]|uniref:Ankyrin repeat-containing protein n=1 Tax=Hexamita inflata TaxID=28002 RepID=A0AA86R765_9EUKA|nr:Ankyrin repeat-containing protein [Hexamita inflata]